MKRAVRKIWHLSVFHHDTPPTYNEKVIALFHRASAINYALFAVWGVLSTYYGVASLSQTYGDLWQVSFSFLVFVAAVPAFIGATFAPKLAMVELLAASSFVALLAVYIVTLFVNGLTIDIERFALTFLIASIAVIPGARCIFIYKSLVKQAKK